MNNNRFLDLNPRLNLLSDRKEKQYSLGVKQNLNQEANIEGLSFLNSREAAAFLGISKQFLMNLTSDGRVPYFKFGRSNRYLKNELACLILENRRGPSNGLQKR